MFPNMSAQVSPKYRWKREFGNPQYQTGEAKKVKLIYMATLKALYEYHNESGSNICYLIKK